MPAPIQVDQSGTRALFMQLGQGALASPAPGGGSSASAAVPLVIVDTTTARTAKETDAGNIIRFTNTSDIVFTIKAYADVPLPVGTILYAQQADNGQVTFAPVDGSVTFETADTYSTRGPSSFIAMKHISLNHWAAMGDLEWLVAACSIVGNPGNADAPPVNVSATADGQRLVRRAGVLAWDGEFAVAAGAADALTATLTSSDVFSLYDGLLIAVRAINANATTTPTLAVNGGTARTITKQGNNALVVGDIKGAGHELLLRYVSAGPRWELLNPAVSGGGSSTIISTTAPASPIAGMKWIDSTEGVEYTYYDDGDSQQWVEFGPDLPKYLFTPPPQGSSFPLSPSDGDRFFRTDLGLDCFYKASVSKWLTLQLFTTGGFVTDSTATFTANSSSIAPVVQESIYVEKASWSSRVTGTNDASNYWTMNVVSSDGTSSTTLGTANTQGLSFASPNTWRLLTASINALATARRMGFDFVKTGTPGAVYYSVNISYRLVVT